MDKSQIKCKVITILSWNIASLRKRLPDLQDKVANENIDVICLQECGVANGYPVPRLYSYTSYNLTTHNSCVMYVKKNLSHTLLTYRSKNKGTQSHGIKIYIGDSVINVVNLYAQANLLDSNELPECVQSEPTIIVGDFSARHVRLHDPVRSNRNGTTLLHILNSYDCVKLIGDTEPTHVSGGILDRCLGFFLGETMSTSHIVPDLLSDHFALITKVELPDNMPIQRNFQRKRVIIPEKCISGFIKFISEWYKDYHPISVCNFNDDLVTKIYEFHDMLKDKPKGK